MINPFSFISTNIKSRFTKKNGNDETLNEEEVVVTKENNNGENFDKSVPQFIDELAAVPVLTMDDFKNKYMDDNDLSEKDTDSSDETETFDLKESTAGVSQHDRAQLLQRRWKVAFWDISVENLTEEEAKIFIEIDFGTSRDEFRVLLESKEYILSNGHLKHRIRTPIIHKLKKNKPQTIVFHQSFEYRGSYFDLEKEKLKLSAWKYHNLRLNTLDAIYDTKLIECANSEINHCCYLMKISDENKLEKAYKISFNLYFQEIYDFQLSLDHWEIKSLMSFEDINKKLGATKEKEIENNILNHSKIIDFNFFNKNADYFSEINKIEKLPDSNKDSELLGNLLLNKKSKKNEDKLFENVKITYKNESEKAFDILDIEQNITSKASFESEKTNIQTCLNNVNNEDQNVWKFFLKFLGIYKDKETKNIMNLDSLLLESELDQSKIHPSDCSPRLKIKLIWPSPMKEYTLLSSVQRGTNWPIWENIGSIFLRGTIADLENSFLDVEVIDTNKVKSVNSQAKTHIPLKGLIENSTIIESKLSEPLWLVNKVKNADERRNFAAWEFGLITGNISFVNYPKQRQKGNFVNFIKDRIYLLVKILKVDNIVTFENIEDFQIHASITHQGLTNRSTAIPGICSNKNPQDDYIIFPLQLPPIYELYSFHLESLAEVYVDLWVSSKSAQYIKTEHAGYISFTIWDTIYNIKGVKRQVSERFYKCYASGTKEKLKVRILEQEMPLKFLFPTDRVSNITFEAFVTPDLLSIKPNNNNTICSKNKGIPEKIDIFLRSRLDLSPSQAPRLYSSEKIATQTTLTGILGTGIIGRFFIFSVFNQRGNELMLSQFVSQMPSPNAIKSPNAIFHFVRCVPFINTSYRDPPKRSKDKFSIETTKNEVSKRNSHDETHSFTFNKNYYWFTPDFTLLNSGGGVIDHCILHVSLLLKIKVQAFVCIGSINNGHFHAWVMSWHFNEIDNNTTIKFWELTTGQIYILKNRFHSQQRAREVTLRFRKRERLLSNEGDKKDISGSSLKTIKLPYKTIDTIFNEMNIWYNIQNCNPGCILFDLWNSNLFLSCTNFPLVHQPGFRSQPYLSIPNKISISNKKRLIKSVLNYELQAHRAAQNLETKWNRDPTLETFLEKGLNLMEQLELSNDEEYPEILSRINNWKSALESKVPHMHRVIGFPVSFNHTNPKLISETILGKLEILFSRDKSFTVSISVAVYGYPNDTYCSRIFILVIQKISERERKRILEQREKEILKNEEKLKTSVEKQIFTNNDSEILMKTDPTVLENDLEIISNRSEETPVIIEKKESCNSLDISDSQIITKDYIGILDKENRMIRKRRVILPDGSAIGKLWISKKIKDDGNFRYYIDNIESSVSNNLNIKKSRVCATELNYEGQRVGFAILPGSSEDDANPIDLMYELALKVDDMLKSDKEFIEFTGGDAVLECEYDKEYYEDQDEKLISEIEDDEVDESYYDEDYSGNNQAESSVLSNSEMISVDQYEEDEHSNEVKYESVSVLDYSHSESNSLSLNEDEYVKRAIHRPDSNSDTSDNTTNNHSNYFSDTCEKDEISKVKCIDENIDHNKSSKSIVNNNSTKELKRFTKTGKYIIYKRPEYEQSKLKKKQGLNDYESNNDESMLYPVASLAISLARGHSELRKNGLLNLGKVVAGKDSFKLKGSVDESRISEEGSMGNFNSGDFFSMFNKERGDTNSLETQKNRNRQSKVLNIPSKEYRHLFTLTNSI